jgi:N4-gp56 family major capsid protein
LLEKITPLLVFEQFAAKSDLPKNSGAKTIRFFRFKPPQTDNIQTLHDPASGTNNEGVPIDPSNYRQLDSESVDVALAQYGQVIGLTDISTQVDLFNLVEQAVQTNGEDAALHCDTLIRNELTKDYSGSNGSKTYLYAGVANGAGALNTTKYNTVRNSGTYSSNYICQPVHLLDSVTTLKTNRAPKIGGYYIAAMPPQVSRDIQNNKDVWIPVHVYNETENVFKGEVGRIYGAKVIEHTNPFVQGGTQGTYSSSGTVFSTHVFGMGAYGVPNLASMSPFAPQVSIVKGADKADPLNQKTLVGFKTFYASKVLQPGWLVEIVSQSGYGN